MFDIRLQKLELLSNDKVVIGNGINLSLNKQVLADLNNPNSTDVYTQTISNSPCSGCGPCYSITYCGSTCAPTGCTGIRSGCANVCIDQSN